MPSRSNMQQVVINSSASGNVTVVANPSSKSFMYIWEFVIVLGGAANITLYNGTGALTGAMPMLANGSIYEGNSSAPHHVIDPGASFIINDSAGVQKSGWCLYSN